MGDLIVATRRHFDLRPFGPLSADELHVLADLLGDGAWWRVRALGWGFDLSTWLQVSSDWIACHRGGIWAPAPGDYLPTVDWTGLPDDDRSTRPCAFPAPVDDFPHFHRLPLAASTSVRFDFRAVPVLEAALSSPTLCTVHPNATLDDFDIPDSPLVFPVTLADPAGQRLRVVQAVREAMAAGAGLVVVPELAVDTPIVDDLQQLVDDEFDSQVVVVAGSVHRQETGSAPGPANVSPTIIAELPAWACTQRKLVPFTDLVSSHQPSREGIDPSPREITVLVSERWRLATVICRDRLDSTVVDVLVRNGVNMLAVPTMTDTTTPYVAALGAFVDRSQAAAVVANNPKEFHGDAVTPRAIFGRPTAHEPLALWPEPGPPPEAIPLTPELDVSPSPATVGFNRVTGTVQLL